MAVLMFCRKKSGECPSCICVLEGSTSSRVFTTTSMVQPRPGWADNLEFRLDNNLLRTPHRLTSNLGASFPDGNCSASSFEISRGGTGAGPSTFLHLIHCALPVQLSIGPSRACEPSTSGAAQPKTQQLLFFPRLAVSMHHAPSRQYPPLSVLSPSRI